MNDLELLKRYLQNEIDNGNHKIFIFDNDYNTIEFKTVNALSEIEFIEKENNKLQSNWNSLREWLEKQKNDAEICKEWNRKNNFNDIDYERDIKRFDFVLDKMNELEGDK